MTEKTPEERAQEFLAEYEKLVKKYGFTLEAIPFETAEIIIKPKLRVTVFSSK